MDWIRINQALQFAAQKHAKQTYKYHDGEPQISHLYFVVTMLHEFHFDDDTLIAGSLHDVVEDTDTSIEDIEAAFGKNVASLVDEVTYDQTLPWDDRQHHMQKAIAQASVGAKAIKTSDVCHQLILFIDEKGQKNAIKNYLEVHTKSEIVWKYESLINAIALNWEHPLIEEGKKILQRFKLIYD